jgi:hypothetical protein
VEFGWPLVLWPKSGLRCELAERFDSSVVDMGILFR